MFGPQQPVNHQAGSAPQFAHMQAQPQVPQLIPPAYPQQPPVAGFIPPTAGSTAALHAAHPSDIPEQVSSSQQPNFLNGISTWLQSTFANLFSTGGNPSHHESHKASSASIATSGPGGHATGYSAQAQGRVNGQPAYNYATGPEGVLGTPAEILRANFEPTQGAPIDPRIAALLGGPDPAGAEDPLAALTALLGGSGPAQGAQEKARSEVQDAPEAKEGSQFDISQLLEAVMATEEPKPGPSKQA